MKRSLAPGDAVGPYRVVGAIGEGASAVVYRAQRDGGGPVALKVFDALDGVALGRFEREARYLALLDHPHVVRHLDHGADDSAPWIAMELLVGEDLSARLRRGPLPPEEAAALGLQLSAALGHAHGRERPLLHRDLKPSNVFLRGGPAVDACLLDLGLARMLGDRRLTEGHRALGTLAYASPEQLLLAHDLDVRSDLWSLGAVLFECLVGAPPCGGWGGAGGADDVDERLAAARVPPPLARVVRRLLRRARADRFESAAATAEALAAAGGAPSAPPPVRVADPAPARCVVAALFDGVGRPALAERIAGASEGTVVALDPTRMLVLFGLDRWRGDEPRRSLRLTRALAPIVRAAGIALVPYGADGDAGATRRAAALLGGPGVHFDADLAALLRGELDEPTPTSAPPVDAGGEGPFVGRDAEQGALLRCVARAADDRAPSVASVRGGGGMGKTRLCVEAIAAARARWPGLGAVVLRCDSALRRAPFGALTDALAGLVDASLVAAIVGAGPSPEAAQEGARAAIEACLAHLSRDAPVVVAVDDYQWLDVPTRRALSAVVADAPTLPLAVWCFEGPSDDPPPPPGDGAEAVTLGPLTERDAAALVRALGGEATPGALERAGGCPRFLEAIAREPGGEPAPLPRVLRAALQAQVDALAVEDVAALQAASVTGRTSWEGAPGVAPGALDRLCRARLLRPVRSRFEGARAYEFRSGALREFVHERLPPADAAEAHRRVAEWLEGRPGASPEEVAGHHERAGAPARAAAGYAAAAARAARFGDVGAAREHAEHTLRLTGDFALRWRALAALDDALQLEPDGPPRRANLDALDALAREGTPAHALEAAWRWCYLLRVAPRPEDRERALTEGGNALALAEHLGAPRWVALCSVELAMARCDAGALSDARAHAARAVERARDDGDVWLIARASATLGYVDAHAGALERSLELYAAAADGFARVGDRRREALLRGNLGELLGRAGRLAEAEAELAAAVEASARSGARPPAAVARHNLGVLARLRGDLKAALALQEEAASLGRSLDHAPLLAAVAVERVHLDAALGAPPDGLVAAAADALARAERTEMPSLVAGALAASLLAASRARRALAPHVAAARAALAASPGGEAEAALLAALWWHGGRAEEGPAAAEALSRYAEVATPPGERAACIASFLARLGIPAAPERAV